MKRKTCEVTDDDRWGLSQVREARMFYGVTHTPMYVSGVYEIVVVYYCLWMYTSERKSKRGADGHALLTKALSNRAHDSCNPEPRRARRLPPTRAWHVTKTQSNTFRHTIH